MVDRAQVLERRRSPLARHRQQMDAGSSARVKLTEVPFLGMIGLRAEAGSASAKALEAKLGFSLPAGVGQVSGDADRAILWLSPDEFLLVLPDEAQGGPDAARFAADLAGAIDGLPGQVVDLSANRTTLELSGDKAQEVLDKSCHLDLDLKSFPAGSAVVTQVGNIGVLLWRVEENTWRVLPRSSFAVYLADWLLDGMREFA